MEEKVLYNTLKAIGSGDEYKTAPDNNYLVSLQNIGLIKIGWKNEITDFGKDILSHLQDKIEKW